MPAQTPVPPYYAVIFTSFRSDIAEGYDQMAERMVALAADQPGFLGVESARESEGITVSYWQDLDAIRKWKANVEHQLAQSLGREKWYLAYKTRICLVERDYEWKLPSAR
ncbi:MAG: antibiotic biosynthesis monooxygenase [Bacteroidetes bacterium]|nr:MAG: antibiotic biosynthesis monooxygenase [Bacteroidota bacterium]